MSAAPDTAGCDAARGQRRFPLAGLVAASVVTTIALTITASLLEADVRRFLAGLQPPLAAAVACGSGTVAVYVLHRWFHFSVWRPLGMKHSLFCMALAVPFMLTVTIADRLWPFADNINVAVPAALLFYPAIALVAEMALHVVPLAVVLVLLGRTGPRRELSALRFAVAAVISAIPEALFQLDLIALERTGIDARNAFVVIHLLLFGSVEALLYRRFDLLRMWLFRITYYAYWHLLWGALRA